MADVAITNIDTRIGALTFTHSFIGGYPTSESIERLYDERDFQRACQAYLWALPAVSFRSWQAGQDVFGADNGEIVSFLGYDARRGILTANATTPYYIGFADLAAGPLVFEMPTSGVRGGVTDAWQRNLPDTEAPAKYLLLAPDQEQPAESDGFAVRRSPTNNILIGVRITETDPERTSAVLAQLRVYPHARGANSPARGVISAEGKEWSGVPPRGLQYWERLSEFIDREPIAERDIFFHAMLKPLGLEKGKPFEPGPRQKTLLRDAALVGEAMAKANTFERRFAGVLYRPDTHWHYALLLDADNPDAFWNLLDERAAWFYEAVSAAPSMAPKKPGPSSAYLGAYKDNVGEWLDGGRSYRLRVPPNAPVGLFWSVTLYDVDTRCLILNDEQIADRSSRMHLRANPDGAIDIFCGPNPPRKMESNWIPTTPGKNWFAYFRFYEPKQPFFDKTWPLPDFQRIAPV